ncbi:hypothetical protein I7I53_04800 [Histoplasma capsulatum var. duboisii H88]|uniref:Uncharacterized protein n=1 Tax=Ajellomyces capsulatus (strain H88) TaxID=544711 RepID=A0A8A1LWM5_AJEC8|nr:hypothetical protein I7I53_04800 [Histoplasma capsulatum var. duboisii H88]
MDWKLHSQSVAFAHRPGSSIERPDSNGGAVLRASSGGLDLILPSRPSVPLAPVPSRRSASACPPLLACSPVLTWGLRLMQSFAICVSITRDQLSDHAREQPLLLILGL